ncbi:hypothetical protein JTY60_01670 [symbiont of Argiope bruennichi]|uniref:hypothetical protein n=1 Tax=symbiont of Argiope bruennichi TaxID=2810479 RepID=UPI003DA390A3
MSNLNHNQRYKKKSKLFSLILFSPLLLLSACSSKNNFENGELAYKSFIKIVKDHFGWVKDDYNWGAENDDKKWNNYKIGPKLKSDITSFLDGQNYLTNLNNTKNWSALYWFPKLTVTGSAPGGASYNLDDISDSNIELIGVGKYLADFYKNKDFLKPYLNYNFLKLPTTEDPSGHFTMLFSLNGYSEDISDIYKITYDFQLSDTAGSFIDNTLSISNVQNLDRIEKLNSINSSHIINTDSDNFKKIFINHFKNFDSSFKIDTSKFKVIGYGLFDKTSDTSPITLDSDWNLISIDSSTFIHNSSDYFEAKNDDTKNFWFNDGSLKKIYFSYELDNKFLLNFSFSLNWQADNNKINRSDDSKVIDFKWETISDSAWVNPQK